MHLEPSLWVWLHEAWRLDGAPALPARLLPVTAPRGSLQFEGGRSAEEIRKFWQNWEHPSINKQEWTRPELEQLKAIAAKHGHLHWQEIAEELGVRTSQTAGVWVLQGPGDPGWAAGAELRDSMRLGCQVDGVFL